MDKTVYFVLAVAVAAGVTAFERFLPFAVFSEKRKPPEILSYLGRMLPAAVMAMLVVFCLRGIGFSSPSEFMPSLIAVAVTAAVYLPSKNTLLGIICGTVCYMLLVQFVFV